RGGCSYHGFAPVGAPPSVRTGPAHFRTRGGCSYHGFVPVGAPPSVRTGPAHFRTRRVLLPRPGSCRSTALGANRRKHIFAPGAVHPHPFPASAPFGRRWRPRCNPPPTRPHGRRWG